MLLRFRALAVPGAVLCAVFIFACSSGVGGDSVDTSALDVDGDGLIGSEEVELGTNPDVADTDADGLNDGDEVERATNPLVADTDEDGLNDGREVEIGSDPLVADTDEDTLSDGDEVLIHGSDPLLQDTDGDGLFDPSEVNETGTNPALVDSDSDGLSDPDEIRIWGSDPSSADGDGDGLDDALESVRGTSPARADTDGDGLSDGLEILEVGTDPLIPDTDGDGSPDGEERQAGTDPTFADTDFDGLEDGEEIGYVTDPLVADTDGDGLDDGLEVALGTDPNSADTDLDGLEDGDEITAGSNPLLGDTDFDGVGDDDEVGAGSDPTREDTDGDGLSDFEEIRIVLSSPSVADTDADTISDAIERAFGLNASDPADALLDPDEDGVSSADEVANGTHPLRPDTDDDGANDGAEAAAGTNPLLPDTDGDGLTDGDELSVGANPLVEDSDEDGLLDGGEPAPLADPDGDGFASIVDIDADGDGWLDAEEIDPLGDVDGDGIANVSDSDADNDLVPDGTEVDAGLDPHDPADALRDPDGDTIASGVEARRGLDWQLSDTDGDGMRDDIEIFYRFDATDPRDALLDFDHDTLSNLEEVLAGTNPRSDDSDNDGVVDDFELLIGSDPLDEDTDDDGALDGEEPSLRRDIDGDGLIGVLDEDSDNDGIFDGEALRLGLSGGDTDGDGISDVNERAAGTDPALRDTDGDGLLDDVELRGCFILFERGNPADGGEFYPSSPTRADTDNDGLPDGVECAYELIPTDPDFDDDGLIDGDEYRVCGPGEPHCVAGQWVPVTDATNSDTDGDGVPDGRDIDPLNRDFDGDGISDFDELIDGFNATLIEVSGDELPAPTVMAIPGDGGAWVVAAAVVTPVTPEVPGDPAPGSPDPGLSIDMTFGNVTTTHQVRSAGPMVITQRPRRVDSSETELSFAGADVRVIRMFVYTVPDSNGSPAAIGTPTLADMEDSDGDGLTDGDEASFGGIWLEAEHFSAGPNSVVVDAAGASNGRAMLVGAESGGFALESNDWVAVDGESYSLFVRVKREAPFTPENTPTALLEGADVMCDGSQPFDPVCRGSRCRFDSDISPSPGDPATCDGGGIATPISISDTFEWQYGGSFRSGPTGVRVLVTEAGEPTGRWLLDRVVIFEGTFLPERASLQYDALSLLLGEEFRVPDVATDVDLPLIEDLPWGASDPMDADTDWDGVRHEDGVIVGSAGWLTDSVEQFDARTNSFDIDSDLDMAFGSADPNVFRDDYTEISWDGTLLSFFGGPDGQPDFNDANDPSPRPLDFDRDGLLDVLEIRAQLLARRLVCAAEALEGGDVSCDDPTTCHSCRAFDYDDVSDLDDVCSLELLDAVNTLPLCWYADDDRDDDGIPDGMEDTNRDGAWQPNELNPNVADTDGDCLNDGVERGLTCPIAFNTLMAPGATLDCERTYRTTIEGFQPDNPGFSADADGGARRTNGRLTDSDGDGTSDGDGRDEQGSPIPDGGWYGEDLNCDGSYDPELGGDGTPETDASTRDTDGDLLIDGQERALQTDPRDVDTDGDGLGDGEEETILLTDPLDTDTDDDGLTDLEEVQPVAPNPATNPNIADTDGDGLTDGDERLSIGALASCEWQEVCGARGSCFSEEPCVFPPTDPTRRDTDGDGIEDGDELAAAVGLRTNPTSPDTDGDTLNDRDERDGTGLLDAVGPSNPLDADSDADGFLDGVELFSGSNPNDSADVPRELVVAPGALTFGETEWVPTAGGLSIDGSVPLTCEGRPAHSRFDGVLTLTENNGQYIIAGTGDVVVQGFGDRELIAYTGTIEFTQDATGVFGENGVSEISLASGGYIVVFDPPTCDDTTPCGRGECTDGLCPGTPGPDVLNICTGQLEDDTARVDVPNAAEDGSTMTIWPERSVVDMRSERVDVQDPRHVGSFDSQDFPSEGRTCFREPVTLAAVAQFVGDFDFSPNPDIPIGSVPPVGVPSYGIGGVGSVSYPDVNGPSFMHRLTNIDFDPSLGQFDMSSDFAFDLQLGSFDPLGTFLELGLFAVGDAGPCTWDFNRGMFSCEMSYTRRQRRCGSGQTSCPDGGRRRGPVKFTFDGRIDVHTHGQIPFQTIEAHNFEGLTCGEDIDLCQNGQVGFNGRVRIPLPGTPGLEAIVEGDLVADVTTRDGDDLFVGMFGTFAYGQKALTDLEEGGTVDFPFPLRLEVANATAAMIFEGDSLEQIVFHGLNGWSMVEQFDFPELPGGLTTLFDPNRGEAKGCLDVDTGRVEGIGTLFPAGFRYDMGFVITPPYRDGQPDLSAGSFRCTGSVEMGVPFGSGVAATLTGEIGFDGRFRFTGSMDDSFGLPGLPALAIPNASVTITNESARLAGQLPLPGLGELTADGVVTSRGGFDFNLNGDLTVAGFNFSTVTGRLNSSGGASLSGSLALPLGNNGSPINVAMAGWYRSSTDWGMSSIASLQIPFGGPSLTGMTVTAGPGGVRIGGRLHVPNLTSITISGSVQTNGAFSFSGTLSQSLGVFRLAGGRLTLSRTSGGALPRIAANASLSILGYSISSATLLIALDGTIEATGTLRFVGQTFRITYDKPPDGVGNATGSVSVRACITRLCIGGTITVNAGDNGIGAEFNGSGLRLGVRSNGCVSWEIGVSCGPFSSFCPGIPVTVCL